MNNEIGLVSIIMAAYNAQDTISKAIESVLSQSYLNFELIIVNDASKDMTESIIRCYLKKDSRIVLINNEKRKGVIYSRWAATKKAKGKWIAVIDSDDEWLPEKLEKQAAEQKKYNADLVYTGYEIVNVDGELIGCRIHIPASVDYKTLLRHNIILNSSSLTRKNLYEVYYPKENNYHEDYMLWLSILKNGFTARGIDEPLLKYMVSKKSLSGNKIKSALKTFNTYILSGVDAPRAVFYETLYAVYGIIKYYKIEKAKQLLKIRNFFSKHLKEK